MNYPPEKILFLDIETVSAERNFKDLSENWQQLWEEKTRYQRKELSPEEFYPQRAGILAEFGRVVCISCGFLIPKGSFFEMRVKSFCQDDERELLAAFADLLNQSFNRHYLCAHNGKEFDFPYLCRRMLAHQISLPGPLQIAGRKPWEVPHLDTMELWKFGDYKNYTSLKLLAALFGIPSPKEDIDGSMVGATYWEEQDLPRIVEYCERDVITLAEVCRRMLGWPEPIEPEIVD